MFISIEGIEGAGKSSLAAAVVNFLQSMKHDVVLTREPGGTPIAESIRHVLLHAHPDEALMPRAELLLMFASRVQHVETLIKPALQQGKWVVCDRFADASFAYQGGGRKLGIKGVNPIAEYVLNGFKPDITLLLDLPVDVAMSRLADRAKDKIEQENLDFFQRVRDAYLTQAQLEPTRIKIVDATKDPHVVIQQAIQYIKRVMHD